MEQFTQLPAIYQVLALILAALVTFWFERSGHGHFLARETIYKLYSGHISDTDKNALKRHDTLYHRAFFIAATIISIVYSYAGFGLGLNFVISVLLIGSIRWCLDIVLNISAEYPKLHRGKDNPFDKVKFRYRFILVFVFAALLFFNLTFQLI